MLEDYNYSVDPCTVMRFSPSSSAAEETATSVEFLKTKSAGVEIS